MKDASEQAGEKSQKDTYCRHGRIRVEAGQGWPVVVVLVRCRRWDSCGGLSSDIGRCIEIEVQGLWPGCGNRLWIHIQVAYYVADIILSSSYVSRGISLIYLLRAQGNQLLADHFHPIGPWGRITRRTTLLLSDCTVGRVATLWGAQGCAVAPVLSSS